MVISTLLSTVYIVSFLMFYGSFNKLSPETSCIQAWLNVVHIFSTLFGIDICLSFLQPSPQSRLLIFGQLTLYLLFHQFLQTNKQFSIRTFWRSFSTKTWHNDFHFNDWHFQYQREHAWSQEEDFWISRS